MKNICVAFLVLSFSLIAKSSEVLGVGDESFFFDLNNDIYESTNQIDNIEYVEDILFLLDRTDYWKTRYRSPILPDSSNESITYAVAGGIVPYNFELDFEPIDIDVKYEVVNSQPNIVFILIDDWGYNDLGLRSTLFPWVSPNINKLISNGVLLENYYTYEFCVPSRGSLMTGRFALRLGLEVDDPASELPLDEITLAQELKSAGYRNYVIGKWHLGYSTYFHMPNQRGFDYFYGYLNAQEDYWTKSVSDGGIYYQDLTINNNLVSDEKDLSKELFSSYLFESKAENVIFKHANEFSNQPMFLYYPLQLVHSPFEVPDIYKDRCEYPKDIAEKSESLANQTQTYCGMNLMVDEVIANITCTLATAGLIDNTIIIISGDNGGVSKIDGDSYPFRGFKHSFFRGGVSNTAVIYGPEPWVPQSKRGTSYSGQVHITDWFPTIMNLATNGQWTGSYIGNEIDGVDMWSTIMNDEPTLHHEIVFLLHNESVVIQYDMKKLLLNVEGYDVIEPQTVFTNDLNPSNSNTICNDFL